jgi:hypothetical protein
MKRLVFGLMLIGFGLVSIQHFSKMEEDSDDAQTRRINEYYEEQVLENKVRSMVNKAKSVADLDKAEVALADLPKQYKERIAPTIALKKATMLFEEAESYLTKAIEVERAAALPPPPPPMPPAPEHQGGVPEQVATPPQEQPRELHPLTLANLNKATALYEQTRKLCEGLKESGYSDFDYHLNYLKGEVYYRLLELVADQESAPEMFNQALTYYKYALRSKNNDINTVINIELLIKNQQSLTGGAQNPQARKKQMLNSKKYGIGKSSGN